MAALWFGGRIRHARISLRRAVRHAALVSMVAAVSGCSGIALPSDAMQPGAEPPYVSLAAKHLQSVLKDRTPYDGFEISGPRWVHSLRGWDWLTCVHFHDRGHLRSYAIFIQDNAVVDARYAVETDGCETQSYTQFDLVTGELGRPTAPVQSPLY